MPAGLINVLQKEQILELLAYLESGTQTANSQAKQ
jgi:hypothetical protein